MSHYAFVNPGGPQVPDLAKAARYGITRLYWQANDPQISATLFAQFRNRGFEVGIMRDPVWTGASAHNLAGTLSSDLVRSDLIERGLGRMAVAPVYAAAHIPTHWDGIAFRFDQLP